MFVTSLVTGAQLLLAAAFIAAGCLKTADLDAFYESVVQLSLPFPRAASIAAPVVELCIGFGLLLPTSRRLAAAAAVCSLVAFTALVWRLRRTAPNAECRCFGELKLGSRGKWPYFRNALLTGLALVVFSARAHTGATTFGVREALLIGLLLGVIALLVDTRARLAKLTAQINPAAVSESDGLDLTAQRGLSVGAQIPQISLHDTSGALQRLRDVAGERANALLLFVASGCTPCEKLVADLAAQTAHGLDASALVIVAHATAVEARAIARKHPFRTVLVDQDRTTARAFGVYGTPSAVLVDRRGVTTSRVVAGAKEIRALAARLPTSQLSPSLTHPSKTDQDKPNARPSAVGAHRGHAPSQTRPRPPAPLRGPATVIFLTQYCLACDSLLELLVRRKAAANTADLQLIVSEADADFVPSELRGHVVVDPGFYLGQRFGIPGTPAAVLIDDTGSVSSSIATGAAAVASLVGITLGESMDATS